MERLSGLDASFLYLETPQAHMHVAMAAVLDPAEMPGGYAFEKVVDLIQSRTHLAPFFRRRLLHVPFNLHHPVWVDDPDFDMIHHVRRVALPAPGGPRELGAMAGRITSTPLDRSRPLWEAWVIEGLRDGHFAILAKVHHCAVDGASGAGLLAHLFSLQRDAPPPKAPTPSAIAPVPEELDLVKDALVDRLAHPGQLLRLARQTAQVVRDAVRRRAASDEPIGAMPLTAPRTPFNASVTARRNAAFARVSLDGIKTIKRAFETKVNDVVLAIAAGALRRYLQAKDALPPRPLVAVVPISVRGSGDDAARKGSNHVSALFTSLPTELADPVERLRAIARSTEGAKREHNAIGADMLQNWAEFAAPRTFNLAVRFYARMRVAERYRPVHNLVISNVPGPPFPIYLAGAELVAAYPMGPVMDGAGLNVTVMSYCGSVDFGFMVSHELMPDVWDLAEAVDPAYAELLTAAQAQPAH